MVRLRACIVTLCLLGSGVSLFSQSKLDSLQVLDEVVVTAQSFESVIPSQRLDGKLLESLNSHSVADALRYFAGVKLKDYGGMGGLKTIDVRHMGSHHVGVFYNGTAVGNAQNGIVDLGKFSLDDVEEISMYNGQKSDIFQSAKDFSSASSIYIRTKRPTFQSGKNTNITFRYKGGTIETYNPSFRIEQKLSDKLRFTFSTEFLSSPGRYKFKLRRVSKSAEVGYDTLGHRRGSDIRANRIESNWFAYLTDKSMLETNVYFYNSQRGLPGAIIRTANGFKTSSGERLGDNDFFIQSAYKNDYSDRYKFEVKGKYFYSRTHYNSLDTTKLFDGESAWTSMMYDNIYYQQQYYLSSINQYKILPNWHTALAVDLEYTRLNASFGNKAGPNAAVRGEAFAYPKRYAVIAALSSTLELGKFRLLGSVQGNYVAEKTSGKADHPSQKPIATAPNKRELTPALFLGYQPWEAHDLNFRLFYKRIFRMPTFNDLYYAQLGTSVLKPEFVNQFNLGATYSKSFANSYFKGFTIQADAYYTDTKDKIIAAPTGSFFRWMMTNAGKVEGYGVEVLARAHGELGKLKVNLSGNYSYSSARDFSDRSLTSYGDQLPYTPWHTTSAIVNLDYKSWMLNYSFIYIGERYNGAVNNIPVNKVQPWYTHDVSLRKDFQLGKVNLSATLEGNNIFDQFYEVVLNYPMPGRNFKFNISLTY